MAKQTNTHYIMVAALVAKVDKSVVTVAIKTKVVVIMGKVGGVRKDNGGFWVFHVDCAKRCLTVPQLMVHNSLR